MSVNVRETVGFWTTFWRALTGGAQKETGAALVAPPTVEPTIAKASIGEPAMSTTVANVLARDVTVASRFGSGAVFGLSARLASTNALNTPVQRREGKAAIVPRQQKAIQSVKAKPKAVEAVAKKCAPARHVWLSSRAPLIKSADIIKFVPRSQRLAAKRAA